MHRRQMIHYEHACATNWDQKWVFMKHKMPNRTSASQKLPPLNGSSAPGTPVGALESMNTHSVFPARFRPTSAEAAKGDIAAHNIRHLVRRHAPLEKYTFPATTAESYGWDYSRRQCIVAAKGSEKGPSSSRGESAKGRAPILDRFARVAPGRIDTLTWYGGGREGLP
ncbi:hypothetical protein BC828DRAFT_386165 [Blastocladiella britannica]|nr:hypothetical protein BC828DRAFT_386165 [Blastocladiella britannica]